VIVSARTDIKEFYAEPIIHILPGCPGRLSNPVRYIPIPENKTIHPIITNFTFQKGNITLSVTRTFTPQQPHAVVTHTSFLIYYLFIAAVVSLALVLFYYYSSGVPVPTRVMVRLGGGRPESFIRAIYEYTGIKKVLRKYYLKLREIFGCTSCTPRELAVMSKDKRLYRFAEVYEDVVYGSKNRSDVDEVVKEVEGIGKGDEQ